MADNLQMTHWWRHWGVGNLQSEQELGRDVGSSTPALDFHQVLKVGVSP